MRVSLFVIAATTLVGAHAAAIESENSTNGTQELDRRLFGSHCDNSSDSDNESGGGGKHRRAERCGEMVAIVEYKHSFAYCVLSDPDMQDMIQRCEQQKATPGSKCYIKSDTKVADCPH
ncbi:hypothetical protein F4775DRAFT_559507 [Biscogniauxia sp. FL1348]|nr:hypothetical protein F4775DRAFT_559507 [Biscogniauxia sp. FL1348]